MPFDVTDQAHIDIIKATLLEPEFAAQTGTQDILDLFNDPDKHAGTETGPAKVTGRTVVSAAFNIAIGASDQFKIQLLIESTDSLDDDLSEFRSRLIAVSNGMEDQILLNTRKLNLMEVLFGQVDANGVYEYINLSKRDYLIARDS